MNLILFEWKKLWKNASVFKMLLFFLILSCILFWGELTKEKEAYPRYLELHETVDKMEAQEAAEWLLGEQENNNSGYEDRKAFEYLQTEIEAFSGYEEYREAIQNRYEQSQSISIFAKDDQGQNEYMRRIAEKYKELDVTAPMELQSYQGLKRVLDFFVSDVLTVVLLLYLVSVVFIQEQKSGKASFAQTMLCGKEKLFWAKTLTVYGSLVSYSLMTFCVNLLLANRVFGTISFAAAIQSVPGFHAVPYAWSIGEYLVAYVIMKGIAVFFLSAAAIFCVKCFSSEVHVSFLVISFVGLSVWLASTMTGDGIQSVLRLWNVWSFLRGTSIINDYELISFGGVWVESIWGILIFLGVSGMLLIFCGKYHWKEEKQKERRRRDREKKPHGLFYYEMKKTWINQGGLFLLIASVVIQAGVTHRYNNYLGTDEYYYQKYIDVLGERITEETDSKILEEEKRLEELQNELAVTTDWLRAYKLQSELECVGGFYKYKDRVTSLREEQKEPVILKDAQYSILFTNTEVSRTLVMLLCAGFAFLIPAVYHKEKETGVETLQQVSVHGKRKTLGIKIGTLVIYFVSFLLISGMTVYFKANASGQLKWGVSTECLQVYWNSENQRTVLTTFIIGILVQCILAVLAVILLSACAKKIKNRYAMTGLLLGAMVVPTLLSPYSAIRGLQWIHDFFFVFTQNGVILMVIGGILFVTVGLIIRGEMKE